MLPFDLDASNGKQGHSSFKPPTSLQASAVPLEKSPTRFSPWGEQPWHARSFLVPHEGESAID